VADDYVNKRIAWSSAHMKIAEWYKSREEYGQALSEYFAISKVAWYSYQPLMEMGDIERLMERPHAAESLYQKAAGLDPNPFVHVRLGMLYYDMNSLQKSIDAFEEAFRVEVRAREGFKTSDKSMARYFLAVAYGKQGNIPKAKSNLEMAVQIDPKNQEAQALLSKLR
jgi:tetratricopeptide (TPR) repeat protein